MPPQGMDLPEGVPLAVGQRCVAAHAKHSSITLRTEGSQAADCDGGVVQNGAQIIVLAFTDDRVLAKIRNDDSSRIGWLRTAFLAVNSPAAPAPAPAPKAAVAVKKPAPKKAAVKAAAVKKPAPKKTAVKVAAVTKPAPKKAAVKVAAVTKPAPERPTTAPAATVLSTGTRCTVEHSSNPTVTLRKEGKEEAVCDGPSIKNGEEVIVLAFTDVSLDP